MRFNPLERPIAFAEPRLLSDISAWVEHIPFAFLLVDALAPRTIVELGSHKGDSHCAFCQAVETLGLPTKCAAVDTWAGDAQTSAYGPDVLAALRAHHDPLYGGFSRLIQKTFDEAAKEFAPGSIDLLHIDGLHTYDAVKHDFETWLPRMSERGVVLFHDTAERGGGFGVWKLWEEISAGRPHFAFAHGHGLGVLAVGRETPEAIRPFFEADAKEREAIRACFATLGRKVSLRRELAVMSAAMFREQQAMNQWKQGAGLPVTPQSMSPEAARQQPAVFLNAYAGDVRKMMTMARPAKGPG